jgi:hypothetical protein
MTFKDVQAVLADFTYKPNVEIRATSESIYDHPVIHIRAVMWTLDSENPYPRPGYLSDQNLVNSMHGAGNIIHTNEDGIWRTYDLKPVKIAQCREVPAAMLQNEQLFLHWLVYYLIRILEQHEIDEWARYKGQRLRDPHEAKHV